jgi:hypothetical protein
MNALAIESAELIRTDIRTRLPFKYGITTMAEVPHVFLRLLVRTPAGNFPGISADHLPPKWFTKDPTRPIPEEIEDMLAALVRAASIARRITAPSAFRFWQELWAAQEKWGRDKGHPPLLAQFGTSLVERALLDALARSHRASFHRLLHANLLGLELSEIHAELGGMTPAGVLPRRPAESVLCRHTVGLADPLRDADIAASDQLNDGLPQSLEACIHRYGLRHFKIKVDGTAPDAAFARLRAILAVLSEQAGTEWAYSLDGNECFSSIDAFRDFWQRLEGDPALRPMLRHLLFVEQPLSRLVALDPLKADLNTWPDRPAIIIDESDGDLGDLEHALLLGYAGTSHKNCKGIFKGVAHACLVAQRRVARPGERFVLSGEDLCNIGPVALLQDLAVQAVLGIESVERNGHHYFAGLSPWPVEIQEAVRSNHPDLYEPSELGWPKLRIRNGRISTRSVVAAPLGVSGDLPLDRIPGQRIQVG